MSRRHRRSTPLIGVLVRLGWQRDPELWAVPCRDMDGRRARLLIRLALTGITITTTGPGPLLLTAPQVGRLRAATRDAVLAFGQFADPEEPAPPPCVRHAGPQEVVPFEVPDPRPTVWELGARTAWR